MIHELTLKLQSWRRIPRIRRSLLVLTGIGLTLLLLILLSAGIGAVSITPGEIVSLLFYKLGITTGEQLNTQQEAILWAIRFPRVLLAVLVGSALAISGAAMQGLFRNPLADPSLIGVSSGAAFFAAIMILLESTSGIIISEFFSLFLIPIAAFAGSMLATILVYRLSTTQGKTNVATMLLAGIAINALCQAGIGYLIFIADDDQLRDITFWMLGSLGGAVWPAVLVTSPFMLIAIFWLPRLSKGLNAMLLGEAEAKHLGMKVERIKKLIILLVALAVGASVSITGVIGFVGLIVPHLLRLIIGPDHRLLLPGSALLGACILLGSDLLARTLVTPAELPIGIVTATLGAPFFLWLLLRNKNLTNYL